MKRSIQAALLIMASALAFSSALVAESPIVIGTAAHAKLYDYRLKTAGTITVKNVEVSPQGETIIVKLYLKYTNEGNQLFTWYFENVALIDSKGKQYGGMSYFSRTSIKAFRDFIRELQPGMTENTFAYFKMPRLAFGDDVSFCFISDQDNKPQSLIKIFDRKKSKYDFKKSGVFSTAVWI
jgi:hypothetical protein